MTPFYSCPECKKEISCVIDTESSLFTGWGAFLKDKCQFCGTKVSVNWIHYLVTILFTLGIIGCCVLFALAILSGASEKKQTIIGIVIFCAFMLFGLLVFYVVLPALFGIMGLRIYKRK
jgi:hypothetical protein